jgi:hypothetical protein
MAEGVTAVGTAVLGFVSFGQLVMFYWQLRLLNRSTYSTSRTCNGRRYERACGCAPRMGRHPILTGGCLKAAGICDEAHIGATTLDAPPKKTEPNQVAVCVLFQVPDPAGAAEPSAVPPATSDAQPLNE